MKGKLYCWVIAICLIVLSGCDKNSNKEYAETEVKGEEKAEMTDKQEAIFRSYGLSEEEIAKMKEEGMDYKQQSFADTAVIMLDYLEEKYGETFEVVGGDIPGILSDEYFITAKAITGEYADQEFDVYYRGKDGCTDEYMNILKGKEACEALQNLIKEQFSDVYVSAEMYGDYGSEITLDMTGEQLLHAVSYNAYWIFTAPDMTEEEFLKRAQEIGKYLNDNNVFSSGTVFCFNNELNPNISEDELAHLIEDNAGTDNVVKWSEYISTR